MSNKKFILQVIQLFIESTCEGKTSTHFFIMQYFLLYPLSSSNLSMGESKSKNNFWLIISMYSIAFCKIKCMYYKIYWAVLEELLGIINRVGDFEVQTHCYNLLLDGTKNKHHKGTKKNLGTSFCLQYKQLIPISLNLLLIQVAYNVQLLFNAAHPLNERPVSRFHVQNTLSSSQGGKPKFKHVEAKFLTKQEGSRGKAC